MKYFLMIFIFALSLKADSSYQSKCVKDFYLTSSGTTYRINVIYSNTPTTVNAITYSTSIISELVNNMDKFTYDSTTSRCIPIPKNNTLGLTNEQYNLMMALTGLLSSILLVSIIFKKV